MSERLVGNRVAPISGIKGSDSGGGPAPRHSIIHTAFLSFHFFGRFLLRLSERSTFAKGTEVPEYGLQMKIVSGALRWFSRNGRVGFRKLRLRAGHQI